MARDAVAVRNRHLGVVLFGGAMLVSAACWWTLVRHSAGATFHLLAPHAAPAAESAYPAVFGMWFVMSVAMMLPPALPWLLLVARTSAPVNAADRAVPRVALFAAGYFSVWAAYSAVAAAVQLAVQAATASDLSAQGLGGIAGGAVLAAAGVVQLTSLKAACLAKCRSPIAIFLTHWRPGPHAAATLGLRHGLHCLGCCWALMGVAFALGVMNPLWMVVLTAAIVAEQTLPNGEVWARVLGVGLVGWGVLVMV